MSTEANNWTILKILDWTRGYFETQGIESARLDAELILAHVLKRPRIQLYAHFEEPVLEEARSTIRELVKRRANKEPLAYLLGEKEFWSLPLKVSSDTLIPRPDTETLVEVALDWAKAEGLRDTQLGIVDVGTGSGAIALALAHELKKATVYGTEKSKRAAAIAAENAERLELADRVTVLEGDLLTPLPDTVKHARLLVANLPYIREDAMAALMPDVRDYEPHEALVAGPDGLALYRRLAEEIPLQFDGPLQIFWEADPEQMEHLAGFLEHINCSRIELHDDLSGLTRIISAHFPGAATS